MNENKKRDIIFLEKFFKKNKDNPIKISQPKIVKNYDIFGKIEEEKTEKPKRNGSQKLKSVNSYGITRRKYNIIKESTIFQETDIKKSLQYISTIKNNYKNNLLKSLTIKKNFNNTKYNTARNDNIIFLRQKSALNINNLYENKLKNVRKNSIYIYIYYIV